MKSKYIKVELCNRSIIQGMRGIAIMLVVLHHAISNFNTVPFLNKVVRFIDMFHVNIFFFIAGYLFMKNREKYELEGFSKFIIKKVKSILVPYYVLTLLFSICIKLGLLIPNMGRMLIQKGYEEKTLLQMFIDPIVFRKPYFISLWFIYVLFIYFFISWFISEKMVSTKTIILAIIVSVAINSMLYNLYPDIIYKLIRYYPYFLMGMIIWQRTKCEIYLNKKMIGCACAIVALILIRIVAIDISFMDRHVRAIYMQIEWLLCAINATMCICIIVNKIQYKNIGRLLAYIGDRSYFIYLTHNPWVIVPIALVSEMFIECATLNIAINYVSGICIPIGCYKMIHKRGRIAE